jgi:hypothetical protein
MNSDYSGIRNGFFRDDFFMGFDERFGLSTCGIIVAD